MVIVSQVSKQFPHSNQPLLHDINLDIEQGQSLAIMGASGSGKSTLLNMVAGLVATSSGRIEVQSKPINQLNENARDDFRATHIGMVFQQFNLIDCLSVEDNIALPARYLGIDYKTHLNTLLTRLGIAHLRDGNIEQLSGGEQQRVAIARALIHRPSLILADEPTGNLDENTSVSVANLLFELADEFKATMLVVTHANDIAARANQIKTISQGTLIWLRLSFRSFCSTGAGIGFIWH